MQKSKIGKVFGATIPAIARQGLFFIPAVLLLPYLFEDPIIGVYIAQSVADVCAFIIAIFLAVKEHRILKKAEIENA